METVVFNPLLLAIIFTSFWERFNVYIGFSLNASLFILPCYLVWILLSLWRKKIKFEFKKIPREVWLAIILIIGSQLFSVLFSPFPFKAFQATIFQTIKLIIMLAVMLACFKSEQYSKIKKTWFLATTLVAIIAIYQFIVYKLSISPTLWPEIFLRNLGITMNNLPADHFTFPLGSILFIRPSSTFIDANTAAGYLAVSIIMLFNLLIQTIKKRKLAIILLTIHFIAFSLMLSRSAWLGLLAGLGLYIILLYKQKAKIQIKISAKTISFFSLIALIPLVFVLFRFIQSILLSDSSSIGRLSLVQGALKLWEKSPFFGVGAGTFEQSYIHLIDQSLTNAYSHSIYLQWLAETGILGFGANMFFVWVVFKLTFASFKKYSAIYYIELTSLCCVYVLLLLANIFYAYYLLLPTYILLGMLLGKTLNRQSKI